jgi:hypothetical protein
VSWSMTKEEGMQPKGAVLPRISLALITELVQEMKPRRSSEYRTAIR